MIIKISKGEIHLKDSFTRKEKYNLDNLISEMYKFDMDSGKISLDQKEAVKVRETKILSAIEKIVVKKEEKEISMDTLFNEEYLTDNEFKDLFQKILNHTNKLIESSEPSKKS